MRHKRPKVVIIDKVRGLTSKRHKHVLQDILKVLAKLGYDTKWQVLNTKDHGIPQSRPRLYIVAILPGKHDNERRFILSKLCH